MNGDIAEEMAREGVDRPWSKSDVRAGSQFESVALQAKELVTGVSRSVGEAVHQIRQDPRMESPDTRKAALKLLAYIAGALLVLNAIIQAPRRR